VTRVLVCGGRDYWSPDIYHNLACLNDERRFSTVITGGARGVDEMAAHWAERRGITSEVYPANWKAHGRAAGPIRNAKMIAEGKPDLVVAFKGGRGTADMVRRAKAAGVEVIEIPATVEPSQ
jgi:predicted Rossmann-fold nucleotide-binding protein